MTVNFTVADELSEKGAGLRNLDQYEETKGWLDQSVAWIIPTTGWYHADVVDSWDMVDWPMNQARTGRLRMKGLEVAEAYNRLVKLTLDAPTAEAQYNPAYVELILSTRFIWTTEQDNTQPPNAITGLMGSIYTCPDCGGEIVDYENWNCAEGHHGYDAVSGLYFTKGLPPRPMAYGDPKNGPDDHAPRSVKEAVANKATIEVNGIGMGGAIWRKDLFRKVSEPWFKTINGNNQTGQGSATQDLYFCKRAKAEAGARFGVNCGVKIGHVDKAGRRF